MLSTSILSGSQNPPSTSTNPTEPPSPLRSHLRSPSSSSLASSSSSDSSNSQDDYSRRVFSASQFTLLEELGSGSFGVVYNALDK